MKNWRCKTCGHICKTLTGISYHLKAIHGIGNTAGHCSPTTKKLTNPKKSSHTKATKAKVQNRKEEVIPIKILIQSRVPLEVEVIQVNL